MSYTIIITTITLEKLESCLANLSRALDPEVLVFDHRSNPKVKALCELHKVQYIDIGDVSYSAAANKGAEMAKHDTLVFMQDDVQAKDGLDRIFKRFISGAVNCPNIQDMVEVLTNKHILAEDGLETLDYHGDTWRGRVWACLMMEKKLYWEAGAMDPEYYPCYYDDHDFLHRWVDLQHRKVYIHRGIAVYHNSTGNPAKFTEQIARSHQHYLEKWGGEPLNEKW